MQALGKKFIAKKVKMDETPSGVQLPSGQHPFIYEVVSSGPDCDLVSTGDLVFCNGRGVAFPYNGDMVGLFEEHQAGILFTEDDLGDTVSQAILETPDSAGDTDNGTGDKPNLDLIK